ncbi:MAG: hypothetical protein ACLQPH_15910 [Acidimicrobiales bacterium]
MVTISTFATANCANQWVTNRSVAGRSWPKLENHVVAAVEVEVFHLDQQASILDGVERGRPEGAVVSVRTGGGPTDGYAVGWGGD